MRWLIRQWHRVQLARELLEQYEHEDEYRITWPQAVARIQALGASSVDTSRVGLGAWRRAVEAHADRYPNA